MQQVLDDIKRGVIAPVYFVTGVESYLIQLVRQAFINLIPIADRELNLTVFDLLYKSVDDVIAECNSVSFFGDRKVVIVDNSYIFSSQKQKNQIEQPIELIEAYLENPNLDTVLIFFAPYEDVDHRKKIVKAMKKIAVSINVNPLKENEMIQFVQHYIESEHYVIDRTVLNMLLKRVNYHLSIVMNELAKLFLAVSDNKIITKDLVLALVPQSIEDNVFSLTEYVLKKDTAKVLSIYDDLVLQKEDPIKLLALLISQFRLLIQVKILSSNGYSQVDIATYLKQHPYRISLAIKEMRMYQLKDLLKIYELLVQADFELKTSVMSVDVQMPILLLKVTKR